MVEDVEHIRARLQSESLAELEAPLQREIDLRSVAWWANDVRKAVGDPAGDGRNELLIPESLTFYEGARCIATWTRIFELRGDTLSDVSSEFPKFYKPRLNELRGQVSGAREEAVCRQIETDKIERVLGIMPDAGFERAQEWMESRDPSLRLKAVCVFADIGDKGSLGALSKAVQDKDPVVSEAAKQYLAEIAKKQTTVSVDSCWVEQATRPQSMGGASGADRE